MSTQRFNQSRKETAATLDPIAKEFYRDYFDPAGIYDVEAVDDSRYDPDDDSQRFAHLIDYAGIDKVLDCRDRIIPIGHRVRPNDPTTDWSTDFSLRRSNGVTTPGGESIPCEYKKIKTALEDGGSYPCYFGFGVYDEPAGDGAVNGFNYFMIIDTRALFEAIEDGRLDGEENTNTSGDGTAALYFTREELREAPCVATEWDSHGRPIHSDYHV